MRGDDQQSSHLFSYLSPEHRVPPDHPLRSIRTMTDEALRHLSPKFEARYATSGRRSVPPEHLLRALLAVDGATAVQPAVSLVCDIFL
jgi:hypothetical protein